MSDDTLDSMRNPVGPVLSVSNVTVEFPGAGRGRKRRVVRAVRNVSFDVFSGETLALVGESGSGKTTTARAAMRIQDIVAGSVTIDGVDFDALDSRQQRKLRRKFQVVLQNPQSSLDPRRTIRATIKEAFVAKGVSRRAIHNEDVGSVLRIVGLSTEHADRFPHELSGGQQQRVNLARAIAMEPQLLICDEPVSALDVSVQAQIINLLRRLQKELGLAYLLISHDLAVVRHMADRVAVMYLGSIVEIGRAHDIYSTPAHPYTAALISAAPVPDADVERSRIRVPLMGEIPRPDEPPTGCHFHPRCPLWKELGEPAICSTEAPVLEPTEKGVGHLSACHFSSSVRGGV